MDLTGAVLIGLGSLVIGVFLPMRLVSSPRTARRGIEVAAHVVGMDVEYGEEDPIYGGGGTSYAPVVSFRTVDGEPVRVAARHSSKAHHRVPRDGTAVRVRYDPGNPRRIHIPGWDLPAWTSSPGIVLGGLAMMLTGGLFIYLAS
jgi:hypothetical protein